MPEGPELHLSSRFVNAVCHGRVFSGRVLKSPVHKSDEVPFEARSYTIAASSRGKEMRLVLTETEDAETKCDKKRPKKKKGEEKEKAPKCARILFRFGMSGKFEFTTVEAVHKHSHLRFFTADRPPMVLSHVDVRRFGRWEVDGDWSKDRGPDPMFDYSNFRSNVVRNVDKVAFERPICEVLLNQRYFNGIGNYLRAEILYRLSIPPFEKARKVLEGLPEEPPEVKPKVKGQKVKGHDTAADLLHLCHTVPLEVVNLGGGGYDPEGRPADYSKFNAWLRCYYQPDMSNLVDHNKRTIWFKGPAGPMVPKDGKSRSPVKRKKKNTTATEEKPKIKKEKVEETCVKSRSTRKARQSDAKPDQSRKSLIQTGSAESATAAAGATEKHKKTPRKPNRKTPAAKKAGGCATRSRPNTNNGLQSPAQRTRPSRKR